VDGPRSFQFRLALGSRCKTTPSEGAPFAEARDQQAREWNRTRSVEAKKAFYRKPFWARAMTPYAFGSVAMFWMIQRTEAFLGK
jgi:hypothetical protein